MKKRLVKDVVSDFMTKNIHIGIYIYKFVFFDNKRVV